MVRGTGREETREREGSKADRKGESLSRRYVKLFKQLFFSSLFSVKILAARVTSLKKKKCFAPSAATSRGDALKTQSFKR